MVALKTLVDDLRTVADEAVKKNTSASQLKTDLVSEGLGEAQAGIFAEVRWQYDLRSSALL